MNIMNIEAKDDSKVIRGLEKDYINYIVEFTDYIVKHATLNKKKFNFISEKEFSNCMGFNENYQYASRNVKQMKCAYDLVIGRIKGLDEYFYENTYEPAVYESMKKLLSVALDFGYCDEATKMVALLKDPKINREQHHINVSSALLKIMENYGKRTILEDEANFKPNAEKLIESVYAGKFGEDTKTLLSPRKMANAYNRAKVVDNDGVFYMMGDEARISDKDLETLNITKSDLSL